jgi:hypothetical protein
VSPLNKKAWTVAGDMNSRKPQTRARTGHKLLAAAVAVCALVVAAAAATHLTSTTGQKPDAGTTDAAATLDDTTTLDGRPSVLVVPAKDIEQPPDSRCVADISCLRRHYTSLAWTYGEEQALSAVERDENSDTLGHGACHDAAHAVGEVAAQRHGATIDAISAGNELCGSGYFHGIVAWEATLLDPDVLIDTLTDACAIGPEGSFKRWECFHGVGHGFSFVSGNQVRPTLDLCQQIEREVDQNPCVSGALMQEMVDHSTAPEYKTDPYVLCPDIPAGMLRSTCYDMLATLVWGLFEPDERFDWCTRIDPVYKADCARGLGRNVDAGMPLNAASTTTFCNTAPDIDIRNWCVEGASVNTFAYYGNIAEARKHCDEFEDKNLAAVCSRSLDNLTSAGPPPATREN